MDLNMKMRHSMRLAVIASLTLGAPTLGEAADRDPRTASGRPDFSGNYDVSTLTPLQRPAEFGDNLELTPAAAEAIIEAERQRVLDRSRNRGPIDEPPPDGGAPPIGVGEEFRERSGAGNVGGYNNFWTDRGTDVFTVDGKFRTSILTDPKNGRIPPRTEEEIQRAAERPRRFRPNDGTAWWIDVDGPGPYDGPESISVAERCLVGFTGATPTLPSLYNNQKSIVQTEDHVMILIEMVHDARVVRMRSEGRAVAHPPPEVKLWMGDSIGWWDDDTLVIETTNFHPRAILRGGSEKMRLEERFSRLEDGNVLYRFTVEDDSIWTDPWSGEYVWRTSDGRVFEYACHEGNYSMGNILRGARLLEGEEMEQGAGGRN